jgi:ABC-type uncharacterized transport system substrate-binding protein
MKRLVNVGITILVLQVVVLLLGSWCNTSFAHPHVFIDCYLTLVFDDQGLVGFQQHWVLDEMFTAFLLEDFDTDGNMKFNAAEIQNVKQGAFENLREYSYFTYIRIDGKPFPIQNVNSFSVEMNEKDRAIYSFFVPCSVKAGAQIHQVLIAVFDETYYSDVFLVKEAIRVQHPESIVIRPRVQKLPELSYYFDQVIPEGLLFAFQKKP